MSDSYQAIYDAVRSRISNADIGHAVQEVLMQCNFSHYADQASNAIQESASYYTLPSVMFRPKVYIDGNKWCALYGDNLQDGVAGFGDSPQEAMREFDLAWARSTVAQCKAAGVPVFVKQLGSCPVEEFAPGCDALPDFKDRAGADPSEWPADLRVQEFPS